MTLLSRLAITAAILCISTAAARGQTNLRGWYSDGQTWLVWEDTPPTPDTYWVYGSTRPIVDVGQAVRLGRLFPEDWQAARLKLIDPGLNWSIPDGAGGLYRIGGNEGVFGHTPQAPGPRYFAVVKDGSQEVGPDNSIGPVVQRMEPIQCHLQSVGMFRGRSYRILAHWINGRSSGRRNRPDYPVMGNEHANGTAVPFRLWDAPESNGGAPRPATVSLHGGGGSFWNNVPVLADGAPAPIHLSNGLLIVPDDPLLIRRADGVRAERTYWLGYWEGYDRFRLPEEQPVPDDALIADYTMRRLDWMVGWLIDAEVLDPTRISVMGASMGGRGVYYNTRRHPERYSAAIAYIPGIQPPIDSRLQGKRSQNLRLTIPGSPSVGDLANPAIAISESERDIPFTSIVAGRNDPTIAGWSAERVQQLHEVNDAGFGHHVYWDERGHTIVAPDAHWNGAPSLTAEWLTRYRSDQSFPAFFNDDQDAATEGRQPDAGDGQPFTGEPWGAWSGYYEWDVATIEDTPTQWGATVALRSESAHENSVSEFDSSTADIAIRRPQQFRPAPGSAFEWTLQPFGGGGAQSGMGAADEHGVVVVPALTITKAPGRLTVSAAAHEVTGVLDAAGFRQLISPGSIVSVFGLFVEETATAPAVPLVADLDGLSVTINGKEAGLFGAFDGDFDQANIQAPWDIDVSSGSVEVRVHRSGSGMAVSSAPFSVDAALASPGIFTFDFGPGRAIVQNLNGSFAQPAGSLGETPSEPAAIESVIIIWANGLGPVPSPPATGEVPGFDGDGNPVLPVPGKTVRALIGGRPATAFPVLHPTLVGLYQVNAVIPADIATGDAVPIVIEVDCGDGTVLRSREDVTIAVRPVQP